MKIKVAFILLLSMCMLGYYHTTEAIPMVDASNMSQKQSTIHNSLKIINALSTVKRGGTGVITIQGTPNTLYNIKTSYKLSNKVFSVIQWRTTDGTGVITFNWVVNLNTDAGTYVATISGGGTILNTNHTVLQ